MLTDAAAGTAPSMVEPGRLVDWAGRALRACEVPATDAQLTAQALVEADLQGVASHGCMLLPMYVERLRCGSVRARAQVAVVEDRATLVVLDAGHALGQVSSAHAVALVLERARAHGAAVVAVRHAFHFGAAAFWSSRIAAGGAIGCALSNTRPLMPAPGGAERVVGNNPLSFAFPAEAGRPLVMDMATSASAMGKIRIADGQRQPIPEGWATDRDGRPTTSAAAAIEGLLLPAAGPKGFGLAMAIDLLCGGTSGGAIGDEVQPLYGAPQQPYDCAHWFLAVDSGAALATRAAAWADRIRRSKRALGASSVRAPGDLERERRAQAESGLALPAETIRQLDDLAAELSLPPLHRNTP